MRVSIAPHIMSLVMLRILTARSVPAYHAFSGHPTPARPGFDSRPTLAPPLSHHFIAPMTTTVRASASSSTSTSVATDPIVQYIVVRRDLWRDEGWPLGSVAAQCCHAATAVIFNHRDDPEVLAYAADLDHMRKVVLEIKGEVQLRNLAERLEANGVPHKLWIEQVRGSWITCIIEDTLDHVDYNVHQRG